MKAANFTLQHIFPNFYVKLNNDISNKDNNK